LAYYRDLAITINGEPFTLDYYGLALGSYDMILGVQCLESLGPIIWDFTKRMITFVRNGQRVYWSAIDVSMSVPSLLAAEGDVLADLLLRFKGLFVDPTSQPPHRSQSHQIRLLSGTPLMAVRPYRCTHNQKAKLERQCDEMLC
jgi:hypothetical protein